MVVLLITGRHVYNNIKNSSPNLSAVVLMFARVHLLVHSSMLFNRNTFQSVLFKCLVSVSRSGG